MSRGMYSDSNRKMLGFHVLYLRITCCCHFQLRYLPAQTYASSIWLLPPYLMLSTHGSAFEPSKFVSRLAYVFLQMNSIMPYRLGTDWRDDSGMTMNINKPITSKLLTPEVYATSHSYPAEQFAPKRVKLLRGLQLKVSRWSLPLKISPLAGPIAAGF